MPNSVIVLSEEGLGKLLVVKTEKSVIRNMVTMHLRT